MNNTNYTELEYKFSGDKVKLTDFKFLMEKIGYTSKMDVSSYDVYYTNKTEEDSFIRLRLSDTPELTRKFKTKENNNYNRVELDIPLSGMKSADELEQVVTKFVSTLNYDKATKLFKSCFIYFKENVNYVYYIVYNPEMSELGRYIEVEVNKNRVEYLNSRCPSLTPNGAEIELNKAAKELEVLGITSQNRLKKSLFEIFVKE